MECNRCNSKLYGQFCSACGASQKINRIDGSYILSEIGSVLNFDKGILYTIRELLLRPGLSIQKFIKGERKKLVKPIVFIIVCSLIYTLFQQTLKFEDGYINYSLVTDTTSRSIFDWVSKNYGYANILISIFIAFWIKILFRKHDYNFFEILILLCYIIGIGMLIFSFFGLIDSIINFKIIDKGFLIGILYISWGIGQCFQGNKLFNGLKGFLSYILGLISFTMIIIALGLIID